MTGMSTIGGETKEYSIMIGLHQESTLSPYLLPLLCYFLVTFLQLGSRFLGETLGSQDFIINRVEIERG